jgi:hypothetical protein
MKRYLTIAFICLLNACYSSRSRTDGEQGADNSPRVHGRDQGDAGRNQGDAGKESDAIAASVHNESDADGPAPADTNLDRFDPNRVYIYGTLHEGFDSADAVAYWGSPNLAIVGFGTHDDPESTQIRPNDGRLIYWTQFDTSLYGFHCDGCQYVTPEDPYPENPISNDEVISTPPCYPNNNPLTRALVGPDSSIVYRCTDGTWYNSDGVAILSGGIYDWSTDSGVTDFDTNDLAESVLHLGYKGALLLDRGIYKNGLFVEFNGLPKGRMKNAFRARDDGFWIVIDPENEQSGPELWQVSYEGLATYVGAYPSLPKGIVVNDIYGKLDADGRLFRSCTNMTDLTQINIKQLIDNPAETLGGSEIYDVIVRRTLDGEAEIVYSELDDPYVKMHLSALFTGP